MTAFSQDRVLVGRDGHCDVVCEDARVSRRHVLFQRAAEGWLMRDTSSGGTFIAGHRRTEHLLASGAVRISLGAADGPVVDVWLESPAGATPMSPTIPAPQGYDAPNTVDDVPTPPRAFTEATARLASRRSSGAPLNGTLTIGRDPSNDVVVDDPLVSRFHARIEVGRDSATLRDLHSFNGTFANGARVAVAPLPPSGADIVVGNSAFRWADGRLLAPMFPLAQALHIEHLTVELREGRRLLDNVSLRLPPASLTAIIGPSGAGKSTLLGALTGLRPASSGQVVWQGHNLYDNYDQLRFQIGLVPQQDIQHRQLTVRQALDYAAQLRLPPDTTPSERTERVHAVAEQLQLADRLPNRIGTELSGGQRKRVSIATELLTAPPLLFLDEPTSGLDPGLDLDVMRQLRALADSGRILAVATHSVLALDVCDFVAVIAPGGKLAYFGPPSGVLAHFRATSYPEVFAQLGEGVVPPLRAPSVFAHALHAAAPVPRPPRRSILRQVVSLSRRNASVLFADKLLVALVVLLPVILAGLSRLVPGDGGLSLTSAFGGCQGAPACELPAAEEPVQRLNILIVSGCLMGVALTIRDLVVERPIFSREYAVGLSPSAYLASKACVLGTIAFLQGVLVTILATIGLPQADGQLGSVRIALAVGTLAFTMAIIGLAASAVVSSAEQSMPTMVGLIMMQLVLSGALFQINGRMLLEYVAWLSPSRWAYAAAGGAIGIRRIEREQFAREGIATDSASHFWMAIGMEATLCAVGIAAAYVLVRRGARHGR